jgi:hypothetical protein
MRVKKFEQRGEKAEEARGVPWEPYGSITVSECPASSGRARS